MLLSTTTNEQLMGWVENRQPRYKPSNGVSERLAKISIATLVGPTAIGKSHLIDKVMEIDPSFSGLKTISTRERRPGESEDFRSISKKDFIEKIQNGELVQYEIHPTTGELYGSDLESYPTDFVVCPILTRSIDVFKKANFKNVSPVGIVASGEQWQQRLDERRPDPRFNDRLREALEVITWLHRRYMDMPILINKTGQSELTAQKIIRLTRDSSSQSELDYRIGAIGPMVEMERVARQELGELNEL